MKYPFINSNHDKAKTAYLVVFLDFCVILYCTMTQNSD